MGVPQPKGRTTGTALYHPAQFGRQANYTPPILYARFPSIASRRTH